MSESSDVFESSFSVWNFSKSTSLLQDSVLRMQTALRKAEASAGVWLNSMRKVASAGTGSRRDSHARPKVNAWPMPSALMAREGRASV